MANKYFFAQPQPVYAWIPTTYEIGQKNTTYRGEKFISDQTTFMMEIMKFLPNIKKEAYRKGVSYKDESAPEYKNRLETYDKQYNGLYGINSAHLKKSNPHDNEGDTSRSHTEYSFGHQHTFGRSYDERSSAVYALTQGFGAGIAVSEDGKGRKKKQIYDFFPNFWDFDGVYKDYLTNANNDRISSFFFSPYDTENTNKNFYRGDYKLNYSTKQENTNQYIDRARDAIPIYKPLDTYSGKGFSIYNNGESISSMTFNDFMKFYPKDFTNSFFGRNPILLKDNKLPSITGYDKINPETGKTHFQEAIDYFNNYTSPKGTAKVFDRIDENGQIVYKDESRASFYDLMMDPDAPWNFGGTGNGWWSQKINYGGSDKIQFNKMLAAFYIVILIVEARRRFLNAMTQWFGPHTQFQGFNENVRSDFQVTRFSYTLEHVYVNNSDQKMIDYFTSWFGNTDKDRKQNKYWRVAEAPSFRTQFLDTFMYTYHEMGSFFKLLSGKPAYIYSKADQDVARRFKNWLREQFKLLMEPNNVKSTILNGIHPNTSLGNITSSKQDVLNELEDLKKGNDFRTSNDSSTTWREIFTPEENQFPTEVEIVSNPSIYNISAPEPTHDEKNYFCEYAKDFATGYIFRVLGLRRYSDYEDIFNQISNWYSNYNNMKWDTVSPTTSITTNVSNNSTYCGKKLGDLGTSNRNESATITQTISCSYSRKMYYPSHTFDIEINNQTFKIIVPEYSSYKSFSGDVTFSTQINADIQKDNGYTDYTKGHKISLCTYVSSNIAGSYSYTLPRVQVTYKNAKVFKDAYKNLIGTITQDPTRDMTLSSYRALQYGITASSTNIPENVSPNRWAYQLYRYAFIDADRNGRSDLEDAIQNALPSDPEAERLLKGGAVAELFREYALDENENLDLNNNQAPAATANYLQMVTFKLKTKKDRGDGGAYDSGSWHFSVGNLRKSTVYSGDSSAFKFAENWFQQLTGWNLLRARDKEDIITRNGNIEYDSPYNRIWGIRTRYLMQNVVTKTIEFIMFQQIVYQQQYKKYKEDMEDYQEQKYEEALEKAREYKKTQERRVKEKELLAKARMKNLEQQKKEARAFRKKQKEKSERSKDKK